MNDMEFLKSKKGMYILATIIVASIAIWYFWNDIKRALGFGQSDSDSASTSSTSSTSSATGAASLDRTKNLSINMSGAEVRELQRLMRIEDSTVLPKFGIDGKFGSETLAALRKLRKRDSITLLLFEATKPAAASANLPQSIAPNIADMSTNGMVVTNSPNVADTVMTGFNAKGIPISKAANIASN